MTDFTRFDPFERRFADAIGEIAAARLPDYLDDVLRQTARTSQRPRWTFPERWLPVESAALHPERARRTRLRILVLLAVLAVLSAVALAIIGAPRLLPLPAVTGVFERTGDLGVEVNAPVTLRLRSGLVLVADGINMHRYDPTTGRFTRLNDTEFEVRGWIEAANGDLLAVRVVEDEPTGRSWVVVERLPAAGATGPSVELGRSDVVYFRTAVALADGRMVILGQEVFGDGALAALIFDPQTGTFVRNGSTPGAFNGEHATLLPDGRILVIDRPIVEPCVTMSLAVYDPRRGSFANLGSLPCASSFSTTVLRDGRVLFAGGARSHGMTRPAELSDAAYLIDPGAGTIEAVGPLPEARSMHAAALAADGRVLIAGGQVPSSGAAPAKSTVLFDLTTLSFLPGPDLLDGRVNATALALSDGRILIVGGAPLTYGPFTGPGHRAEIFR